MKSLTKARHDVKEREAQKKIVTGGGIVRICGRCFQATGMSVKLCRGPFCALLCSV